MEDISNQEELDTNAEEALKTTNVAEETAKINNEIENSNKTDGEQKSERFSDGEEVTLVKVRFPGNAKAFTFLLGSKSFAYGQRVVAMSDRGMSVGYINSFPYIVKFEKSMLPLRSIARLATEDDLEQDRSMRVKEKEAEIICNDLIEKYGLDMNLTHVEFIQFGKKSVFYFNAPARVDFRELVKELVSKLKMRIELRQISIRDRAAAIGAIGSCGLQTCCSTFLSNYGRSNIKMAKNQNLALIPSKLMGACGQIKCCIRYENNVYTAKRKILPKETDIIKVKNGDVGKVLKLHILKEEFELLTDKGKRRRYSISEYLADKALDADYKYPTRFDHIVNETDSLIGSKPTDNDDDVISDAKAPIGIELKESETKEEKALESNESEKPEHSGNKNRNNNRRNNRNYKNKSKANNNNNKNEKLNADGKKENQHKNRGHKNKKKAPHNGPKGSGPKSKGDSKSQDS